MIFQVIFSMVILIGYSIWFTMGERATRFDRFLRGLNLATIILVAISLIILGVSK